MSDNLQTAVEEINQIIISTSKSCNIRKSEVLAQVIKSCLLSDDENPNHINGIELFQICDKCFSYIDEDDTTGDLNTHLC